MKHYPPEFKADAVALFQSRPGTTIAQIADDLGINRETKAMDSSPTAEFRAVWLAKWSATTRYGYRDTNTVGEDPSP